jgi:hypothetical protein
MKTERWVKEIWKRSERTEKERVADKHVFFFFGIAILCLKKM